MTVHHHGVVATEQPQQRSGPGRWPWLQLRRYCPTKINTPLLFMCGMVKPRHRGCIHGMVCIHSSLVVLHDALRGLVLQAEFQCERVVYSCCASSASYNQKPHVNPTNQKCEHVAPINRCVCMHARLAGCAGAVVWYMASHGAQPLAAGL